MRLTEERRKEIEQSLSLAKTELRMVNDDPSASGIHVAMVHGRYFAAWNAAVIELLVALAEAEQERDETGRLLRSYDDPRVTRWWLQRDEIKSRLRELEAENARLRDQLRQVREVCLEDASRYSRPSIGRWKRLLNLPANRYLQKQAATSTSCRFSKCGKR